VVSVLRDGSAHLARVVDEQGRTTGVVTLDDVLAALVFELPAKAMAARAAATAG
jgi:CBS domain containing-hemolysin-like protein